MADFEFRGVLDWPVSGRVVQGFGMRLDPQYKTRVPHNGLDLNTRAQTTVQAIFPGKILFAAPFQGYGLTVVIHHPGRVFTLYAGLEGLRVRQGDMVSLGQALGPSTGKLYFEIREENQPVDPLGCAGPQLCQGFLELRRPEELGAHHFVISRDLLRLQLLQCV